MENFPQLDIQEDLAILEDMDEPVINIIEQDLSMEQVEDKPMDIFIGKPTNNNKVSRPTNKKQVKIKNPKKEMEILNTIDEEEPPLKKIKKPLSEKQKAHLERIRAKALIKRKEKAQMKKEALEKVNEEYAAKKTYKKRTIKTNPILPEETKEIKKPNNLSDEENANRQLKQKPKKTDDESFIDFMENMGKFQNYMVDFNNTKKIKKKPILPVRQEKIKVLPNPVPEILKQKSDNPYDSIFQW